MTDGVRTFLAVDLPPHARDALAGLVLELGRAEIRGLVPAKPDGIHLTLKFLGNVSRAAIDPLVERVTDPVASRRPFSIALGDVGAFPNATEPRVLWVGVQGDLASLHDLQQGLEDALASLGYDRERRPFSPHLTVARLARRAAPGDRRRATDALFSARWEPGSAIEVDSVNLIRSELHPDGARHHRLARIPLGDGPAPDAAESGLLIPGPR